MNKRSYRVTVPVCVAILAAGFWLANAGSLDPPAGPVTPTMVTLDEIYAATGGGPAECPPCVWEVFCIQLAHTEPWQQIVAGSGVVHSFTITRHTVNDTLALLSDGLVSEGGRYLGAISARADSLPTSTVSLDVRFENGLYVKTDYVSAWVTVLYRSD